MRGYISTWQNPTAVARLCLPKRRLTDLPFPVWAILAIAGAFSLTALAGRDLPQAAEPQTEQLRSELATVTAEATSLRSEIQLKSLAVDRFEQIHRLSHEYKVSADLATLIYDIAVAEQISPELAFGLVRVESGFERTVVSPKGAIGYTQLLPSTAKWLDPGSDTKDLFETHTNLHLGFRYLNQLLEEYNGDKRLALLAYNRGPTRVGGLLSLGIDPANGYARKVLGE